MAQDIEHLNTALKLPATISPNKYTIPAAHFKMQLRDASETQATVSRLMALRASTATYQHVQMRQDKDNFCIYLWHDTTRVRRERNPNRAFAGEKDSTS